MQIHNKRSYSTDKKRQLKFVHVANEIVKYAENKGLAIGDKLPSVNEFRYEFGVSKNTVIRSYGYLNKRRIIKGVPGKGSYLMTSDLKCREKVLCVFNNVTDYKGLIFSSLLDNLGVNYSVDLTVFDYDCTSFTKIINENIEAYDYFVIMPFFRDEEHIKPNVLDAISAIPSEKLILLDKYPSFLPNQIAAVYQDFENDLCNVLNSSKIDFKRYKRLSLLIPEMEFTAPKEIIHGFIKFCKSKELDFRIVKTDNVDRNELSGELFIILEEEDLVTLLKQTGLMGLKPGKDIGLISYNEHPFKELLNISTISTNFSLMGKSVSDMIARDKRDIIKNDFCFLDRKSA